ncbi:hypothetical protein, partial [Pseudomonas sp. Kh14]|uniref:hypothetical protein n=1 Tax=Pseudomonas sp. Kh14 TaxID=2093745 RepID=UPI001C497D6D
LNRDDIVKKGLFLYGDIADIFPVKILSRGYGKRCNIRKELDKRGYGYRLLSGETKYPVPSDMRSIIKFIIFYSAGKED